MGELLAVLFVGGVDNDVVYFDFIVVGVFFSEFVVELFYFFFFFDGRVEGVDDVGCVEEPFDRILVNEYFFGVGPLVVHGIKN